MTDMENTDRAADNRRYAGQVADIARRNNRVSFYDKLERMTPEDGRPYLYGFAKKPYYLVQIFNFKENYSLSANLPVDDLDCLEANTQYAMGLIKEARRKGPAQEAPGTAETKMPPAFTPLKMGSIAGKTAGGIILSSKDPGRDVERLRQQVKFLESKLGQYPNNRYDIERIKDAIDKYELGILEEPSAGSPGGDAPGTAFSLFDDEAPKVKYFRTRNKTGDKNLCYEFGISCTPSNRSPFRISIANYYAPVKVTESGMTPVLTDQKEEYRREHIDVTATEWTRTLGKLRRNAFLAELMWYPEARKNDAELRHDAWNRHYY